MYHDPSFTEIHDTLTHQRYYTQVVGQPHNVKEYKVIGDGYPDLDMGIYVVFLLPSAIISMRFICLD